MAQPALEIGPYALTTLESARDYLALDSELSDWQVVALVNEATAALESACSRRFVSREHVSLIDGNGRSTWRARQYPVTDVSGAYYTDYNDTEAALDVSGARFDGSLIVFPHTVLPRGKLNVRLVYTAGYIEGEHDTDLARLGHACRRLVQVFYQDWKERVGRGTAVTIAGMSVQYVDAPFPKDVLRVIADYSRF